MRSSTRTPRTGRRNGYLDPRTFATELMAMGETDTERRERMHVVSVVDFREAVGAKWDKVSGLVEVATDQIIRRHVNTGRDIYTRIDAETACLAMRESTRQEAHACVASIARDLHAHLFGDMVVDGRRPQIVTTNMSIPESVTNDPDMNRPAIRSAIARARASLVPFMTADQPKVAAVPHQTAEAIQAPAAVPHAVEAPAAPAPLVPHQTAIQAPAPPVVLTVEPKQKAPETVLRLPHNPHRASLAALMPKDLLSMLGASDPLGGYSISGNKDGGTVSAPDWMEEMLMAQDAEAKASGHHMEPESMLTLVWTPTWVTRNKSVGAYQARVIRVDRENSTPLEGVHAYREAAPVEILTMDRFIAIQTAVELKDLFYSQQKIGLTIPFHWMSLAPRWRDCVRIPLESCPSAALKKFLKIEIFGLNQSVRPSVLQNLFGPLEKLGCDVMVRLPLNAINMVSQLRSIKAVGVDLAELDDDERVGDDELFRRLDQFREGARKAQMASYVWGVRRRELIARIVSAGFSMVNGPGVMCDVSHPIPATAVKRVA